jgi:hypothetical protein
MCLISVTGAESPSGKVKLFFVPPFGPDHNRDSLYGSISNTRVNVHLIID